MTISYPADTKNSTVQQGMIAVIFEKNQRNLRPLLGIIEKSFQDIIRSSFHARLEGEQDLMVIIVSGVADRIRALERELVGKRGVRSVRLTIVPRE